MIKFLTIQIRLGNITLEQVPQKYRADVIKALNNN